jgi:hypothetical protein
MPLELQPSNDRDGRKGRSVLVITADQNGNLRTDLQGNLSLPEIITAMELLKNYLLVNAQKTGNGVVGITPRRF